jgi:HlyD family secretion protein
MLILASPGASRQRRFWLAVAGLLVVTTLVALAARRPSNDIDGDRICPWVGTVGRGTMVLRIRTRGTVVRSEAARVRVVVSLDATEGALARVGQSVEIGNGTRMAQGRVIDVLNDRDIGVTGTLAEFGSDAPEQRPGSEVSVTIEAGAILNALFVGRPAWSRSNSQAMLFRLDPRTGNADRVRVRYGHAVGDFAQIVNGLEEGDEVILSDLTGYEHVRRIRF